MRIPETYKCDHPCCEAVKSETNHWYVVTTDSARVIVEAWDVAYKCGSIMSGEHYCGADHAVQAISRWVSERAQG